jgi:glycosyltransferase involved in cell wall biosynthesis
MNRLHHLKQTLPKNLKDNEKYPEVEFVILDYNSQDGLEDWAKKNFSKWQGKVNYYKTDSPEFYDFSHSRNLAMRMAKGDIICNLDADNYTGPNFCDYINKMFQMNENIFLSSRKSGFSDLKGRICFHRNDFHSLNGYDEKIDGYGYEDIDFLNRLKLLGRREVQIKDPTFLHAIQHDNHQRVLNNKRVINFKKLFILKKSPTRSAVLFVYKNKDFEFAEINDSCFENEGNEHEYVKPMSIFYRYNIIENSLQFGSNVDLNFSKDMFEVTDMQTISDFVFYYTQLFNKAILKTNAKNKVVSVNKGGIAETILYKNFNYSKPLLINT